MNFLRPTITPKVHKARAPTESPMGKNMLVFMLEVEKLTVGVLPLELLMAFALSVVQLLVEQSPRDILKFKLYPPTLT